MILKWRSFEFEAESGKRPLLFMSEIGIFEKKFKRLFEESFTNQ